MGGPSGNHTLPRGCAPQESLISLGTSLKQIFPDNSRGFSTVCPSVLGLFSMLSELDMFSMLIVLGVVSMLIVGIIQYAQCVRVVQKAQCVRLFRCASISRSDDRDSLTH